ncbi:UNVERIFIED_CONTAM: hypothetical protein PYX00_006332 [Menopon gallinae]|uniref:Nephrin n=2 Tax=Menopon gallinae TaxID=328185 RepID=A0AAW2HW15_9NEOP
MFYSFFTCFILLSGYLAQSVILGSQQYFRLKPKDTKIQEGGEALMECEISELQGQVQWTKDGFALGFPSDLPGYPRYSYVGDRKNGVYNLRITNVSLEDDAEFQCQVLPTKFNKEIWTDARLTVIAPPSSIEIVNNSSNNRIEIKENVELEIECLVKNSKPAAKIVWYHGHTELKPGRSSETVIEVPEGRVKRYNVLSKIKIKPTAQDDLSEYTCEARHEALPRDMPLKATVQLSVLYPPGEPYIEGYTERETIRRGQTVELICRSRGGNPPAQLIWYKNGEQIRMAYRTVGRLSENIYTFTADSSDNKAKYKCEASNVMSREALKAEITLTVLFAPAHVTISGATEAKAGDKVSLTCTSDNSNPPADIKWMVGGKQLRNTSVVTTPSPNGGSISTSNITVLVGQNRRSLVVVCHGLNMHLTENIVGTHTINVLYPPGHPIISGYTEGTTIAAGTLQMISCISSGGNPLATLTWYKNDKKINSVTKVNDRSVSAEITVYTNVTDNGAVYKCEAENSATDVPFIETVKLNVQFPPEHVRIRKEPTELKPGQVATLTCESSSSNPPAKLSWWKEGIPVEGATTSMKPGLHGGMVSTIELKVNITSEINGVVYTCQALNEALQRSVHDAFTLDVLFKPIFKALPAEPQIGTEGEPLIVILESKGNPSDITYTWTMNGASLSKKHKRIVTEGPVLNVTRLSRNDSGVYTCKGENSQGSASISFNLTVHYPAQIVDVPSTVVVNPEENAELYCTVEGNPLSEGDVTWRNEKMDDLESRTTKSFRNTTSYLLVLSPTRKDAGVFQCAVNNGIGNETVKEVVLLVKYKPEIDTSPARTKAASNLGTPARLTCRASAVPKPTFRWLRNGLLVSNSSKKYSTEFQEVDATTFDSILTVNNVESGDYGNYECEVRNEKGLSVTKIMLDVTSAPDTPTSLTVLNVTHDAVTLSWVPGFDGGIRSSYRIRYKPHDSSAAAEGFRYLEVLPDNVTTFTINGLELNTEYIFNIMAFNRLGGSKYLSDSIKAKTANFMLPEELRNKVDIARIVIVSVSITVAVLVMFNIALAVCFILRKRNQRMKKGPSEQGSNKSATIEMYAPSSYNETVTGETLSSVSEKSENYSNAEINEDYTEDGCKVATSTYLIDQIDYPFQYPAAYEMQHQMKGNHTVPDPEVVPPRNTLPHNTISKGNYVGNSILPPPTIDGAYYNLQPDSRYIPYPQSLDYNNAMPAGNGSLRRQRGPVLPDVTVLHNTSPAKHTGPVLSATLMPQPALSTFAPGYTTNLETEGHLV